MNNYKNNKSLIIEGSIERIVYRSDDNGYTVFELLSVSGGTESGAKVTCTAYMPEARSGESVRVAGNFVMHPSYGRQFSASSVTMTPPSTTQGIIKYLSASIKGIGERMAVRITNMFGGDTFDIIENHPDKLAKVNGISRKKALDISVMFKEQSSLRNTMIHLQSFGISPAFIQKIYKRYKEASIDVVRKNPYALADEIIGVGFKTADAVATRVGIEPTSEFRVKAALKYILSEGAQDGHVFLEKGLLIYRAAELLGVDGGLCEHCLSALQFDRQVIQEALPEENIVAVYLNKYYYAESYAAKKLLELLDGVSDISGGAENDIQLYEQQMGVTLADNQKLAITAAMSSGVVVVTGGPGTGKTTVINAIISLFKKRGLSMELTAPTGRAAKRMEEATRMEAKTIHRLLGITVGEEAGRFEKDENDPLESDVLIVDESSMVDIMLMYCLLKALPQGARLILVGDADQLPSVGPGNVLNDIIISEQVKVVKLTDIFRQSEKSAIVTNAHKINRGERPELNRQERGFFFVRRITAESVSDTITDLMRTRLPSYINADPKADIQVLTPMRKGGLGASALNQTLQQALNPPCSHKREKEMNGFTFREGDKVMQIKNNYNLAWQGRDAAGTLFEGTGVYNGDDGIIVKIDEERELIRVTFDGKRQADYSFDRLDELELSYAVTIHKSQGSEYRAVVIPILAGPPPLMTRNLLYTAVTRARELVVIVGLPETLYRMVDNNREIRRFSALGDKLRRFKAIEG